jgi:hypothetical protein
LGFFRQKSHKKTTSGEYNLMRNHALCNSCPTATPIGIRRGNAKSPDFTVKSAYIDPEILRNLFAVAIAAAQGFLD